VTDLKARALAALGRCGGDPEPRALDAFVARLDLLDRTGRHGRLLSDLLDACNDVDHLHSLILEVTFACAFESRGRPLRYEVQERQDEPTSVDFLRSINEELQIYFELRLLQQPDAIARTIEQQLTSGDRFGACLDGEGERDEIFRLQSALLEKVQRRDGRPIKFFSTDPRHRHLVVIGVSDVILGAVDTDDCRLAMYGDHGVHFLARRGVFGLVQEPAAMDADSIRQAARFKHFRTIVDGVVFLRRDRRHERLAYDLKYLLLRNPARMTDSQFAELSEELGSVFEPWDARPALDQSASGDPPSRA